MSDPAPALAKTKFNWRLLGRFIAFLRPFRGRIVLLWLFTAVETAATLVMPLLMKIAIDDCIAPGDLQGLLWTGFAFAGALAALFAAGRAGGALLTRIGYGVLFALRRDLFARLQGLSFRFFDGRKTGQVMTRLTSDVQVLEELLQGGLAALFSDAALLLGTVGLMIALDPRLSLVLVFTVPLLALTVFRLRGRLTRTARGIQAKLGALNGFLNESIGGVKVIRSFAREERSLENFRKVNGEYYEAARQFYPLNAFFWQSVAVIGNLGAVLVLAGGGLLLSQGLVTVGTIAAFLSYVNRFFHPLQRFSNLLNQLSRALASCERIFEILDQRPEVADPPRPLPLGRLLGRLAFDCVDFGYLPDEPVLRGLSFEVPAGSTAAIVGPTGAGKTTVVNLLCRFYDPEAGSVRVDGRDIREFAQDDYRGRLALVMQEATVFSGSVFENIAFSRPGATLAEVRAVAAEMGVDGMFQSLPDGYHTAIGERGGSLSLGQRQLVAFCRALLRDPAVLILDEASAYIDTATEKLMQTAMRRLRRGRTTVVIAHRLSTIRDADIILVIRNGRLEESGTHRQLLKASGHYAELLRSQYSGV